MKNVRSQNIAAINADSSYGYYYDDCCHSHILILSLDALAGIPSQQPVEATYACGRLEEHHRCYQIKHDLPVFSRPEECRQYANFCQNYSEKSVQCAYVLHRAVKSGHWYLRLCGQIKLTPQEMVIGNNVMALGRAYPKTFHNIRLQAKVTRP